MTRRMWTEAELERLHRMWNEEGVLLDTIASLLGRSRDSIKHKLRRSTWAKYRQAGWTVEEDRVLLECIQDGWRMGEIAAILGRTRRACIQRASRLRRAGRVVVKRPSGKRAGGGGRPPASEGDGIGAVG